MKIPGIIFLTVLFTAVEVYSQWINIIPDFNKAVFIKSDTAFITGSGGILYKTTDGGDNFNVIYTGTSVNLNGLAFADESNGVTVGNNGTVMKTSSGGKNWTVINSGVKYNLNAIWSTNQDTYFAVGDSGTIMKSTNGGNDWVIRYFPDAPKLYDVEFTSENSGVIVGEIILKTTDGGVTWNPKPATEADFYSISFATPTYGVASGNSQIIRTTDGGESWSVIYQYQWIRFPSVHFSDSSNGMVIHYSSQLWPVSRIMKTSDGGDTWTDVFNETDVSLNSICVSSSGTILATGREGNIFRSANEGSTWDERSRGDKGPVFSVHFVDSCNGTAVTYPDQYGGKIMNTSDGGTTWFTTNVSSQYILFVVRFFNRYLGLAGGEYGRLFRTTDSGRTWTQPNTGMGQIHGIAFQDSNNVLIAGWDGIIKKSTDAGLNWIPLNSGTTNHLNRIIYTGAETFMAIGYNGTILRSTDGGTSWSRIEEFNETLRDVCFINENTGFIIGDNGLLLYTQDGGLTWVSRSVPVSNSLRGVAFADQIYGIIVGENGVILRTYNGGSSWMKDNTGNFNWLSISYPDVNNCFAGASDGLYKSLNKSPAPILTGSMFVESIPSGAGIFFGDSSSGKVTPDSITGLKPGNYNILLKLDGFKDTTFSVLVLEKKRTEKTVKLTEKILPEYPEYILYQNYPNPFNPGTVIRFQMKEKGPVTIKVFNLLGIEVETLIYEVKPAGTHEINWNGSKLSSGIYFYRINAGNFTQSRKMTFVK
jgi:photosystem II stability/assembly factor-like uncharacterized protein